MRTGHWLRIVAGTAGIGFLFWSLEQLRLTRPIPIKSSVEQAIHFHMGIGPPGSGDWGRVQAELHAEVTYPSSVRTDESFPLTMNVSIQGVHYAPNFGGRVGGPGRATPLDGLDAGPPLPPSPPTDQAMREMVMFRIQSGDVKFSLLLQGANTSPATPNDIGGNLRTWWSVKPTARGTMNGFLKPEFTVSTKHISGEPEVLFQMDKDIPVTVKAVSPVEPLFTRQSVLTALTSFFGSYLTLQGLFAIKEKRKEKNEAEQKKRQDVDAKKPKIIVP